MVKTYILLAIQHKGDLDPVEIAKYHEGFDDRFGGLTTAIVVRPESLTMSSSEVPLRLVTTERALERINS